LSFGLGDMMRMLRPAEFFYPGRPSTNAEVINRYETLYFIDRTNKFE
jgi:hypothetical protein